MGAIAFTVQYDCIFIKRGDLDTETDGHTEKKKTLCEYEDRALDDVSTSRGIPKIDGNYQKLGRKQGKDFHSARRRNEPCLHLHLRLLSLST